MNKPMEQIRHQLPVIALFLCIAALGVGFTMSEGQLISGDMGIYITIANAVSHSDLFEHSTVYSNMENFGLLPYTLTPSLIRWSIKCFNSYMPGIYLLSFANIFFLLICFYGFCSCHFKNRLNSLIQAFILLTPLVIGWGTSWGLNTTLKPRTTFLCFFIWVLFFAFKFRRTPKAWPLIMGVQGLLIFIHPVSTFAAALGLWCSFFPFLPATWSFRQKISWMLLCGICFLVAASPSYIHLFTAEKTAIPYAVWKEAWATRMMWMNFYQGLGSFCFKFFIRLPLIPAAIVLSFCAWKKGSPNDRAVLIQLMGFTIGILATVSMFFGIYHLSAALEKIPPHTELIRSIKFLLFSGLLGICFSLHILLKHWHRNLMNACLSAVLLCFVLNSNYPAFVKKLYTGALHTIAADKKNETKILAYQELINFASQTPPNSRFLGNIDLIPLRNLALRPLAFSFKDGAILIAFGSDELSSWTQAAKKLTSHPPTPEPVPEPSRFFLSIREKTNRAMTKLHQFVKPDVRGDTATRKPARQPVPSPGMDVWYNQALLLKADYIVLKKNSSSGQQVHELVWENATYFVIGVQ